MYAEKGNHIITAATEHKAILDTCKRLEKEGIRVTYLPVQTERPGGSRSSCARRSPTRPSWSASCTPTTKSACCSRLREIGKIAKERGVLFHTDATQAVGKIPVDVIKDNIDLVSISAHKMYGPKGVGALYVRRRNPRVQLTAQMDGGGHERGMRSGTLNVPGIVGLGEACAIAKAEMAEEIEAHGVPARQAEGPACWRRSTRSTSTAPWSTGCRTI